MAPFDEVAKAELHKSSEDKDDLSWCPLVDGYQTKGLKTSLFRMNGGKLAERRPALVKGSSRV